MLRTDWLKIASIVCISFYLVGCSPVAGPNAPNDATPSPSTITETASVPSEPGDSTPMSPTIPTPAVSGPERLIQMAKEDLARRLSVPASEINLVEASHVTWPDSSLGCPKEGMAYAQVLTPGYLILLKHDDNTFEYHASTGNYVVSCENPSPPVPGMPDNT